MKLVLLLLLLIVEAGAASLPVGRFSSGDLTGWQTKTFRGKKQTLYSLAKDGDRTVLQTESRQSASGLLRKLDINPAEYPILRWSWKIDHTLKREDARTKEGDDFAARVYLVFPGTFFWQTRAINYVWSSHLPKETMLPNAYTKSARIVVVESGEDHVKQWMSESRNIVEDFRRCFGEEPPRLGAVAIMTDTDNTGEEALAWYGDISLENGTRP